MNYFTFFELEYSKKAVENNIKNAPTPEVEDNLRLLVENLLDPLRELYGKPIIIGSGFRNEKVNKLVGGVKNSQHKSGCAADLQHQREPQVGQAAGREWTALRPAY